jgi:hypothetical protein
LCYHGLRPPDPGAGRQHTREARITVTVKLYGTLALYAPGRVGELAVVLPGPATAGQVLQQAGLPIALLELVALNGDNVQLDAPVADGDLLEAFPLVGGGQGPR